MRASGNKLPPLPLDSALEVFGGIAGNSQNLTELFSLAAAIVPFVGAGLSVDFGLPLWGQLIRDLAGEAKLEDLVEPHLQSFDYERALDVVARARPRLLDDTVRRRLDVSGIRRPLDRGAVRQLPRIARGPVITSNLDRLIEHAFDDANRPFQLVCSGVSSVSTASRALQRGDHFLLKLHGDIFATEGRVTTLTEYEEAYGSVNPKCLDRDLPVPALLEQILSTCPILFLGCSLKSDRTVRVIGEVARRLKGTQYFALLSSKEATPDRCKQLEAEWNIRPIFFPEGNYGSIETLLCLLANSLENDFLVEGKRTRPKPMGQHASESRGAGSLGTLLKEQRVRRGLNQNQLATLLAQPAEEVAAWEAALREPLSELLPDIERILITGNPRAVDRWLLHLEQRGVKLEPDPLRILRGLATSGSLSVEAAGSYQGLGRPHDPPLKQLIIGSDAKLQVDLPWSGFVTILNAEGIDTSRRTFFCLDRMLAVSERLPAGPSFLPKGTAVLPVGGPAGWNCAVIVATRLERFSWNSGGVPGVELAPTHIMAGTERLVSLPANERLVALCEYEVICKPV